MSTTNPVYSVFTVKVKYKDIYYDAEIKPTLNGKQIEWIQKSVDAWNLAERTDQLFSRQIEKMLNKTNNSSIEDLEVVSVDGFSFATDENKEATQEIWEQFIECLQDPVSPTVSRDPIEEDTKVLGPGVGITFKRDAYLNLGPEEQQKVRLSLFKTKCYEHFALTQGVRLGRLGEYTPAEKACLNYLLYSNPSKPKLTLAEEIIGIFFWQKKSENKKTGTVIVEELSEEEKIEMASHFKRIREEVKQAARQPIADESSFDLELDSSDEEYRAAAKVGSSSEEVVHDAKLNLRMSGEISLSEEGEDSAELDPGLSVRVLVEDEFSFSDESFTEY